MKTYALYALLGAIVCAESITTMDYEFMKYISEFNKMYSNLEEYLERKELFFETHKFIEMMNNRESTSTYRAGHNFMSDWTADEK